MEHILIVKAELTRRKRRLLANEERNNKYHYVGKVLKSNIKIVERYYIMVFVVSLFISKQPSLPPD
jgi:hypothetical protein